MSREKIVEFLKKVPAKMWLLAGGVPVALVLVWMLMLLVHRPSTRQPVAPARASVQGWQVEMLNAEALPGLGQLNGLYTPGKTLFVPAGTEFLIVSQPAGIRGELEDDTAAKLWNQNGGRIDHGVQGPAGTRQVVRAPLQPGLYRLGWNPTQSPALLSARRKVPVAAASTAAISPQEAVGLDVLVLTEAEVSVKGDRTNLMVNGRAINGYLDPTKSPSKQVREHASAYQVPRFFAMLTPEAAKLRLGPDFELGQLVAFIDGHDKDGHKTFTTERHTDVLPLRIELIEKLIKLRERLIQKGVKVTRFSVTSGFRTPAFNRSIKGAAYSRHCYGDAVDIFIDEDNDHHMDDLNGDGKLDRKDGLIIANACRELEMEGAVVPGGIGLYEWDGDESVRSHVHIDCRGFVSRWGQYAKGKTKGSFVWWPLSEYQEGENGE